MPNRPAVLWQLHWRNTGDPPQVLAQIIGIGATNGGLLPQLVELPHEYHGLGLGHPVVIAAAEKALALVRSTSAAAVVIRITPVDQFLAHASDRATFAGRNVLGFLKAEAAHVANRAALAAFVFRQPGLTGILDYSELVLARDGVERVHVAWHAENVHGHDRASAFGDPALNGRRVDSKRRWIGVGKHRQSHARED